MARFLVRLVGITGLFAGLIGLVLAFQKWDTWGYPIAIAGGALALIALLWEIKGAFYLVGGKRGAFGFNVFVQILLATLLVVGINYYSFYHYRRFDWTHDHRFTLPETVRQEMSRLQGDTTIVVYQRHKTFGQTDKPDLFDYAAERKVVERVRDLVDQFRELGQQFRVVVLDVEEEGFSEKLAALTKDNKSLKDAIDAAVENSIFFAAQDNVQRLGFHDIFQLDKQTSQNDENLVLLYQGVEPFARKILQVDEKRPRIAVATIHEILGLEGSEELGMAGVKKALSARGFDTRDLILKKWGEFSGPEPAVLTFDESRTEQLDAQLSEVDLAIKNLEEDHAELKKLYEFWKSSSLDELSKKYADQLMGRKITEPVRTTNMAQLQREIALRDFLLSQGREEHEQLTKDRSGLKVENLQEQRRITDLKAKLDRMLADCDMLIVPRMTLFNVSRGEMVIPNRYYRLDDAHVLAIRDFLKAGKPVLACFGPSSEQPARMDMMAGGPDKMEDLLVELGLRLSKQTVLFNVESKAFAERRSGIIALGPNIEVPPVRFDWESGSGLPALARTGHPEPEKPNPIRESLRLGARSMGKDQNLDLRLRHPRPVYYEPAKESALNHQSIFMMADPASWNENDPFPSRDRTPRYEPSKSTDPGFGSVDEKRRGPFPIGVAIETKAPQAWYTEKDAKAETIRVAAIGHGGVFIGPTLAPAKEKLLMDTCNWLLGRDDLLTKDKNQWSFPRVTMSENNLSLIQWGTRLGLPLVFAYLGLVVLMVRRLR